MKTFETPYVEVKKFDVMDILTTSSSTESSGSDQPECETEMPLD